MSQSVRDSTSRRGYVHVGHHVLHLVMARLVKEITQAQNASRFAGEVQGQGRSGSAKESNDRVQFLPSILEVSSSNGEVSRVQSGSGHEKNLVLSVPELVRTFRIFWRLDEGGDWLHGVSWHGSFRKWSLGKSGWDQGK